MKFEFNNAEASEIMEFQIRKMVPVPDGYEITGIRRPSAYSNETIVTLERIDRKKELTNDAA